MAEAAGLPDPPEEAPAWTARKLLRATRVGTLATSAGGQPFASLITPACAADGSVLMLLSALSEHTRHLRAEPRCAVMVAGDRDGPNPQTAPRLTVTGSAELEPEPAMKARWLAVHPYAALYAGFTDFALFRVRPRAGSFIGGFARAFRLTEAQLAPDLAAVAALAEAEPGIIAHCNADHADTMALLAGQPGAIMVTVDVDGCDLACGEDVVRVAWGAPVADANGVRGELIRLAREARAVAG